MLRVQLEARNLFLVYYPQQYLPEQCAQSRSSISIWHYIAFIERTYKNKCICFLLLFILTPTMSLCCHCNFMLGLLLIFVLICKCLYVIFNINLTAIQFDDVYFKIFSWILRNSNNNNLPLVKRSFLGSWEKGGKNIWLKDKTLVISNSTRNWAGYKIHVLNI